jgi:hypothetical protein
MDQRLEDLINQGNEAFYKWMAQLTTLSGGSLTVLVALRPEMPAANCLYLLKAAWLCLAAAAIAGVIALEGRHRMAPRREIQDRETGQPTSILAHPPSAPPTSCRIAATLAPIALAAGLASLAVFAVLN